jgi:hypothetical protein
MWVPSRLNCAATRRHGAIDLRLRRPPRALRAGWRRRSPRRGRLERPEPPARSGADRSAYGRRVSRLTRAGRTDPERRSASGRPASRRGRALLRGSSETARAMIVDGPDFSTRSRRARAGARSRRQRAHLKPNPHVLTTESARAQVEHNARSSPVPAAPARAGSAPLGAVRPNLSYARHRRQRKAAEGNVKRPRSRCARARSSCATTIRSPTATY